MWILFLKISRFCGPRLLLCIISSLLTKPEPGLSPTDFCICHSVPTWFPDTNQETKASSHLWGLAPRPRDCHHETWLPNPKSPPLPTSGQAAAREIGWAYTAGRAAQNWAMETWFDKEGTQLFLISPRTLLKIFSKFLNNKEESEHFTVQAVFSKYSIIPPSLAWLHKSSSMTKCPL